MRASRLGNQALDVLDGSVRHKSQSSSTRAERATPSRLHGYFPSSDLRPGQFREPRQHVEVIGHEAVVVDLEDRWLLVLVDGGDDLRIFYFGQALDRARYAAGEVKLGATTLPA